MGMDEASIQLKRRENEEQSTADRAKILGLPYLDTRPFEENIPLIPVRLKKTFLWSKASFKSIKCTVISFCHFTKVVAKSIFNS